MFRSSQVRSSQVLPNVSHHSTPFPAIPNECICPITLEIMQDPVALIPGGHSIERSIAEELMRTTRINPMTRDPIRGYVTNRALKNVIEWFKETYPNHPELSTAPANTDMQEPDSVTLASETMGRLQRMIQELFHPERPLAETIPPMRLPEESALPRMSRFYLTSPQADTLHSVIPLITLEEPTHAAIIQRISALTALAPQQIIDRATFENALVRIAGIQNIRQESLAEFRAYRAQYYDNHTEIETHVKLYLPTPEIKAAITEKLVQYRARDMHGHTKTLLKHPPAPVIGSETVYTYTLRSDLLLSQFIDRIIHEAQSLDQHPRPTSSRLCC